MLIGWPDLAGIGKGTVRISGVMIADLDIYRTANLLIEQHGDEAPIHAAMRADELLDNGDLDGCAVWKQIIRAIEELQDRGPAGDGEAVH